MQSVHASARTLPPIPAEWPLPVENPECSRWWQMADGAKPVELPPVSLPGRAARKIRRAIGVNHTMITLKNLLSVPRRRINAWIAESPSTRDINLIRYQLRKHGLRKLLLCPYDARFYAEHEEIQIGYQRLADVIFQQFAPTSVCDLGCGNGFIIQALGQRHIEVRGVEGSPESLNFVDAKLVDCIVIRDLTQHQDLGTYDLVISTEVAEHIPKKYSTTFVDNLARAGRRNILFSAAHPGQWGDRHINCQPREFWINLFERYDWVYNPVATDTFTHEVKNVPEIISTLPWMIDNFMVFSR
jgi:SAM-dependent methyltransferase